MASGPIEIPTSLLTTFIQELSKPLSNIIIINLSFSTGTFPGTMKIAKIITVFK